MEQINSNPLFRWLVSLPTNAEVWHGPVFTHNPDGPLEAKVAGEFLAGIAGLAAGALAGAPSHAAACYGVSMRDPRGLALATGVGPAGLTGATTATGRDGRQLMLPIELAPYCT